MELSDSQERLALIIMEAKENLLKELIQIEIDKKENARIELSYLEYLKRLLRLHLEGIEIGKNSLK